MNIERIADVVVAGMRERTAKVDFRVYNDGVRISIFTAIPEMDIKSLNNEVKAVRQKIAKAKIKIMGALANNPEFSDLDAEILDTFRIGCSRGGLMVMGTLKIEFSFAGSVRDVQSMMYKLITDSFKSAGIKASTEVEEVEEIEPQGSKPIKERRKSS